MGIHKGEGGEVIDGAGIGRSKGKGNSNVVTGTLHNSDCWNMRWLGKMSLERLAGTHS